MKSIETLLPHIMPKVPGAAEPLVLDAIVRTAQEFCQTTRLWRYTDAFDVDGAEDEFLAAPCSADIFEVESAIFEGVPLKPRSITDLNDKVTNWRALDNGGPRWITQTKPDTLMLVPRGTPGRVEVTLTLRPCDCAESLPCWMIDKYSRVLADGATAELMVLPGHPFTNAQLAGIYSQRFQMQLDRLFNQNIKGQQKAPARTTAQFF